MNWHKLTLNNADTLKDLLITEDDTIVTVLYKPLMHWYKQTERKPNKRYIRAGKVLVLSQGDDSELDRWYAEKKVVLPEAAKNEGMTWVMQRGAYMPIPNNCIKGMKL